VSIATTKKKISVVVYVAAANYRKSQNQHAQSRDLEQDLIPSIIDVTGRNTVAVVRTWRQTYKNGNSPDT